jgi:ribosomal protein S18 acetylase RimI-like enzyme
MMLNNFNEETNRSSLLKVVTNNNKPNVEINLLEESDIAEFIDVRARILKTAIYNETEYHEIYETQYEVRTMIEQVLYSPLEFIIVARVENKIVGFVLIKSGLYKRTQHSAELEIGILQERREKGIGRELVKGCIDTAIKIRCISKITLITMATNVIAIKLFQSMGFSIEATIPSTYLVDDERVAACHMGLLLN